MGLSLPRIQHRAQIFQLVEPYIVHGPMPTEEHNGFATFGQQLDELSHIGRLGDPCGLADDVIELPGGLQLLAAIRLALGQDDPRQLRAGIAHLVQRIGIRMDVLRNHHDRWQLSVHFNPCAPQHQAGLFNIAAKDMRLFDRIFGAAAIRAHQRAPFPGKLIMLA
jgi:hypothetical protein